MPNQISNWSITNAEKICREYIKIGFQQQDFKKTHKLSNFPCPRSPPSFFL